MLERMNFVIFAYVNHFAGTNPTMDGIGITLATYMPLVFVLWALYLWFAGGNDEKNMALFVTYAAALGLLLNYAITKVYFHPRPFMIPVGKLLIAHPPETSFPSDHASFMLSISLISLCFPRTRLSGGILFLLGAIGGTARVFCGLHFPLDIVGSLGGGMISACSIYLLSGKLSEVDKRVIESYNMIIRHLPNTPE